MTGEDYEHPVLVEIIREYGMPIAELIVTKKHEIERYCPSGHYPTPVRPMKTSVTGIADLMGPA